MEPLCQGGSAFTKGAPLAAVGIRGWFATEKLLLDPLVCDFQGRRPNRRGSATPLPMESICVIFVRVRMGDVGGGGGIRLGRRVRGGFNLGGRLVTRGDCVIRRFSCGLECAVRWVNR